MHLGLAISVLLHVGLLTWALLAVHSSKPLDVPETPPLEVAVITASELTRLKQGDPNTTEQVAKAAAEPEKEISKKEAPKPKPVTAPEPPAPAPEPPAPAPEPPKPEPPKAETPLEPPKPDPIADKIAALPPQPEPPPGPTPEELKKAEEQKAEEQRKADEKRKAEEKKKADAKKKAEALKKKLAEQKKREEQAKKKQFDADRIAALLDKTPEKKGAPARSNSPSPDAKYKGPTAGNTTGTDSVLSAREIDALNGMLGAQLRRCYSLPGAGGGASIPTVELRWRLKPDGMLEGQPEVVNGGSGPLSQVAIDTAMRAVIQCQPFSLPPDKYQVWKVIERVFDPSNML